MASLFTGGKFQASNALGVVPGARLYTYVAGTTTPLATYTDQGGLSSNANPVVCDAKGQASVWLGTSAYRMILKDASDATIWDVDNVGVADASAVTFLASGSGAVSTTLQTRGRLQVWSADFGHLPSASAAVNDAALLAAMNAVYNAGGGTVRIAAGTYQHITVPFTWAAAITVNLIGSGETCTVLQKTGATTSPVLNLTQGIGVLDTYSEFADFTILGNAKGSPGMRATLLARCRTKNLKITDCDIGLDLVGSLIWDHHHLTTNTNNIGVRTRKSGSIYANLHNFFAGEMRGNSSFGVDIGEASGVHFYGTDLEQNGTTLNTATGNVVIRSTVDDESGYAQISLNGVWCEASYGTNITVEAASGLALTVRDAVMAANEAGRVMVVGAIQSLILDNVQCGSAADVINTAAARCSVRGGVIYTLTDTSADHVYAGLVTGTGTKHFEAGGTTGRFAASQGGVNSGSGAASCTTAVATTLFSAASAGLYQVFAYLSGGGTNYQADAIVSSDGTNVTRRSGTNGANLTITVSGANVQTTQTSGLTQTISYAYLRIA